MGAEGLLIANLLRVAKGDLDDARLLFSSGSRNAIYLCAQAAEKVIRAVLTSEGKHGGIGHRLPDMVDLVPDPNPIKPKLRAIEDLGAFATAYRYPTAAGRLKPAPKSSEFEKYAAGVARALNEAVASFGVDLTKPEAPAGTTTPIR